jgi:hypothetical protein
VVRRFALLCVAAAGLGAATATGARAATSPVDVSLVVSPGPHIFGDQIRAEVNVVIDTKAVDLKAVHVDTKFDPYTRLETPHRTTTSSAGGSTTLLRYSYLLTCDTFACLTGKKKERTIHFAPATVRYRDRNGKSTTLTVRWPKFRLVSRFGGPRYLPQTASDVTRGLQYTGDPIIQLVVSTRAPSPSYRLNLVVFAALLFAAGLTALVGAGTLARPLYALARRQEATAGPELTPLEQALAAVDAATRRQPGNAEHREALAWLARELPRANLAEFVGRARRLAWSEQPPTAEASRKLAGDVDAAQRSEA